MEPAYPVVVEPVCKHGVVPLRAYTEVVALHRNGKLVCRFGRHVDDVKIIGELLVIKEFLALLEQIVGKLK
eukprot:2213930-Lingulodinium_polyedra.AAC.1